MDIYIYDAIEQPIARDVARSLSQNPREAVTVHVNSYGGSVSEALAIFNALQAHAGPVTVLVEGVAYSAATVIACAARCVAYESALFGFHNPWTETTGPADKHRDAATPGPKRLAPPTSTATPPGRSTSSRNQSRGFTPPRPARPSMK